MLELQNKLDSVTTDFGKTVANLKMTKEVFYLRIHCEF